MAPSNNRFNSIWQDSMEQLKPSLAFVVIIFGALVAFEIFNYSTTDYALSDLLGGLQFLGLPWSTLLALAFCGIDFAGIARLFTPEQGADEPKEVWYLFGAWLLAATMNAILTWWGVAMAVVGHTSESAAVIDPKTLTTVVPVFVAIMVWVIRILIIGTLSLAMDRLLHPGAVQRTAMQRSMPFSASTRSRPQVQSPSQPMSIPASLNSAGIPPRASMSRSAAPSTRQARSAGQDNEYNVGLQNQARPEPTYHSLSMSARPAVSTNSGPVNPSNPNRFQRQ